MNENENRPAVIGNGQGEISFEVQPKDTENLSKRQKKVAELLMTGKFSAADITISLHYSDPRSYIRELREKGINVSDEWIKSDDVRFKRYWITPEKKPEVSDAKSIGEILEENFGYLLNLSKLKNNGNK